MYLSSEGVIGENWLPPQALNINNAERGMTNNIGINLIANFLNTHWIPSISNKHWFLQRKMTVIDIGNIAHKQGEVMKIMADRMDI